MFDANQLQLPTSGRAQVVSYLVPASILASNSQFLLPAMCQFRPDCIQLMNHFTAPPENCVWQLAQINYAHLWGIRWVSGSRRCSMLRSWSLDYCVNCCSAQLGAAYEPIWTWNGFIILAGCELASCFLPVLAPFGFVAFVNWTTLTMAHRTPITWQDLSFGIYF